MAQHYGEKCNTNMTHPFNNVQRAIRGSFKHIFTHETVNNRYSLAQMQHNRTPV